MAVCGDAAGLGGWRVTMGRDWDEIFAYETVKMARVHDKRLVSGQEEGQLPAAGADKALTCPSCCANLQIACV